MSPLDDLLSIFSLISTYQNAKNILILDHDISSHINHITNNHFSKFSIAANIDKIIWFDENNENSIISSLSKSENSSIVFLLNLQSQLNFSKLKYLSHLIPIIKTDLINIHLIISHSSINSTLPKYLSNSGLLGDLTSYHIYSSLLYTEISPQIYSLEYNNDAGFNHLYLDNSIFPLELLAKSLLKLYINSNYKLRFTSLYLKGNKSLKFYEIYNRLLNDHLQSLNDYDSKILDDIDNTIFLNIHSFYNNSTDLIIFDRSTDIISCLLSQLSYSGLCNEILNPINQLDPIKLPNIENSFFLNDSTDEIYPIIKYLNFSNVGPILNKYAKNLQLEFEKRKNLKDINEMKTFVNDLNNLKLLQSNVTKHTNIAEFIIEKFNDFNFNTNIPILDDDNDFQNNELDSYFNQLIELQQDIISNQLNISNIFEKISTLLNLNDSSLNDIFKLIILTSIIKNGLKISDFTNLYNELVNKFSINKVLPILLNLQKLKILQFTDLINTNNQQIPFISFQNSILELSEAQNIQNFNTLSKTLNLLPIHNEKNNNILNTNNDNQVEDENENENDITKLYNDADFGYPGYVPIFTRLIQSIYSRSFLQLPDSINNTDRAIRYGWNNLNLDSLNGTLIEKFLVPDSKRKMFSSIIPPKISDLSKNKSTILIVTIGGLTWSEISTIKYVLKLNPFTKNKNVIFLTTGMIISNQFIESLSHVS
jgi:hypothetical protein